MVTRRPLLVTRKLLLVTQLNKSDFKEIHILKWSFSENVLFSHKLYVFLPYFEYKKFPSNSIKVRREMWYTGRDSFAFSLATARENRGSPTSSRRRQQSTGLLHLDYSSPSVYKNMGKAEAFPIFLGIMCRFNRMTWGGVHPPQGWGAFPFSRGANGVQPTNRLGCIHLQAGCIPLRLGCKPLPGVQF